MAGSRGAASNGAPPTITSAPAGGGGGGLAATGAKLYVSLGCSACHSISGAKGVGPDLQGRLQLEMSSSRPARPSPPNDAYLLESIRDPDKQIVKGLPEEAS